MKKILFYPGTFNPPHLGHVSAVEVAAHTIGCDEVWIMPSGKMPNKFIPTSTEDRKNLVNLFIEHLRSEIDVPVKMITTAINDASARPIHEHILQVKSGSGSEIFQLAGIDGFLSITERVIGPNEKFVIIKRSGYAVPEELYAKNNLIILNEEVGGISSTKIREMIKNGDGEYKKLVPEKIAAYIEERGLYYRVV